jgi:hypothetical protein
MQHVRIGSCGKQPSVFAEAETKFRLLPGMEKTFVQQPCNFYSITGNKHAGAVNAVKPFVILRLRAVTHITDPEIGSRSCPHLNRLGPVRIVADGTGCPDFSIGHGLFYKRGDSAGGWLRVVIEQPKVIGALGEGVSDSDVVAASEA